MPNDDDDANATTTDVGTVRVCCVDAPDDLVRALGTFGLAPPTGTVETAAVAPPADDDVCTRF